MQFVKVFDNQRKCIVKLILNTDNKISYDYFKQIFPDAVGLLEMNEEAYIGIPLDGDRNFSWDWKDDTIYDLIYIDSSKNRIHTSSTSSTSSTPTITYKDKFWAWMGAVGGLFSSTKPSDHYKKLS